MAAAPFLLLAFGDSKLAGRGVLSMCVICLYAVEPPQELPAPAVQPKQCARVTTFRFCQAAASKVSIVIERAGSASRSSIWLKSQSKRRPSQEMEIVLRHIRPVIAAGLNS